MPIVIPDQAAGLRRMFSRGLVRTVTVTSGNAESGRSAVVADLAVALARRGQNACVGEQGDSNQGPAARLGLTLRHDLADFIRRDRRIEDILLHGPEGVRFFGAAWAGKLLGMLPQDEETRLTDALSRLDPPVDFLLLDSPAPARDEVAPWAAASSEIVVVVSAAVDGITEAYGLIKRLSQAIARRRFHAVVTRAGDEDHARTVHANLAATAERFLGVTVAWLGWMPPDPDMSKALRLHQAVSCAFPMSRSAAAIGAVADTLLTWPYAGEDGLDGFVHRLVQASRTSLSANVRAN